MYILHIWFQLWKEFGATQYAAATSAVHPAIFNTWRLASSSFSEPYKCTDTSFIFHALKLSSEAQPEVLNPLPALFIHHLLLLLLCLTLLHFLQDIDVAYATDPAIFDDFEADLTSLLEVPDLDFSSSQDFPRATYRDSAFASTSAAAGKHLNRKERLHLWRQFNEKPSIISGCPGWRAPAQRRRMYGIISCCLLMTWRRFELFSHDMASELSWRTQN